MGRKNNTLVYRSLCKRGLKLEYTAKISSEMGQSGGAVRRPYCDSSRNGSTSAGATTTATNHATRTGTCSATNITIRPAWAHASDSTGSIATGTTREGTEHGFLVHHRFHESRSGQNGETCGQLAQHYRTHYWEEQQIVKGIFFNALYLVLR